MTSRVCFKGRKYMERGFMTGATPPAVLLLLLGLSIQCQAKFMNNKKAALVPAVLVFGDSIVDPGNNNMLPTISKSNFPPYGRDFAGHKATGRFSNGKIPTDMIVSYLGIKELLPAYLDPELKEEDILTGVSFASGCSGYDNLTATSSSVLSLWDQLDLFKDYKRKLEAITGEEQARRIIGESIYILFAGSNDLLITYFSTSLRSTEYDLPAYIDYMVNSASSFIKDLYHLGARRIGIAGVPPLGCVPEERTLRGGTNRDCVNSYNQASIMFNSKLSKELGRLDTNLPGSLIIYMDVYTLLLDIILNPLDHGFEESTKGCCGTGEFEASILCNNLSPFTCTNASNYVFWDSFHPTQRTYEILIPTLIKNYIPLIF